MTAITWIGALIGLTAQLTAMAQPVPGKYSAPAGSHYSDIEIIDYGSALAIQGNAWFGNEQRRFPTAVYGTMVPDTSVPGLFKLYGGTVQFTYGQHRCSYPYFMTIFVKDDRLTLQGREPAQVPPFATGCPDISQLKPYIATEIYGPFVLKGKSKRPPVEGGDKDCNRDNIGKPCGREREDKFWGKRRGTCMPRPSAEPTDKPRYVCVYGG